MHVHSAALSTRQGVVGDIGIPISALISFSADSCHYSLLHICTDARSWGLGCHSHTSIYVPEDLVAFQD